MIKVAGVLHIKIVTGRHGDFRVGRLVTELGEFAVKDAELDQYDEGKYEGEFGINQISPSYYQAAGRLVVEVRASLGFINLNRESALESVTETSLEQDPLDEGSPTPEPCQTGQGADAAVDNTPEAQASVTEPADVDTDEADIMLFGLLWPLTDNVKLDPTIDRGLFRKQRDRLKALGYTFQPLSQQWVKS